MKAGQDPMAALNQADCITMYALCKLGLMASVK